MEPSLTGQAIPSGQVVHTDWLPSENVPNSQSRAVDELYIKESFFDA